MANKGRPSNFNAVEIEASEGFFPPLKLKEGELTTIPEKGAVEYHDGHLMFTGENDRYAVSLSNSVKTTTTTVENTIVETTVQSKLFPANSLHEDQVIRGSGYGSISNVTGADDFVLRFKVNGSTIHTLTRVGGNVSGAGWFVAFVMTIRSTGVTGAMIDFVEYREGSTSTSSADITEHVVDTTEDILLEMTIEWDAAKVGNIFTSSQGFIELIH